MRAAFAWFLLLSGSSAFVPVRAQTAPDAGALRQQLDNERKPALPQRAAPLQAADKEPLTLPEGATITVDAFRFEGNTLIDAGRLQPLVQGYTGHPIHFADLQRATQAVAAAYREAGWIVQAWLPRQDVTEGTVTIRVVEARFAGAHLEGRAPLRLSPELVIADVQARQPVGAPLNADALDRGLLLADDLPGVSVTGALEPGANDGETGLALRMTDDPLVTGQASVDNDGSRSTGAARLLATLTLESPLGIGDELRTDVVEARGSHYGRVAYTLPLNNDGLRGGMNVSHLDYRLVGADFAALHSSGSSDGWGADFSFPLLRSRQRNLYLSVNGERTTFVNRANGVVQSNYGVSAATVGLSGNLFDDVGGGGANTASLTWELGDVRQGHPDPGENPAVDGGYDKLRYSLSRHQALTPALALYGAVNGQYANKLLDSSARFYLGGPAGVRAYPVNEGAGDRGQVANLELRWRALDTFSVIGFEDWGHVSDHAGHETLKGAGVSVVWNGPANFNAQATLARRIGSNADHASTGKDQDGTLERNRLWLQAQLPF